MYKNKIFLLFFLLFAIAPANAFCAEIILKQTEYDETQKKISVDVVVDPQSNNLNVVEGTISFSWAEASQLKVVTETENSILTVWPVKPEYNVVKKNIQFVGGSPDGFNKESKIFTINIYSLPDQPIEVSFSEGMAYLADGKGTQENLFAKGSLVLKEYSKKKFSVDIKSVIIILICTLFAILIMYGYKKLFKK